MSTARNMMLSVLGLALLSLVLGGCAQRRAQRRGGLASCGGCAAPVASACNVSPCAPSPCAPSPCAAMPSPCASVAGCSTAVAPQPNDRPPSGNPGEAWCRVWIPAQSETRSDTVMVKPATKRKIWTPAVYGKRPKLVCVSEPKMDERIRPGKYVSRKVQVRVPGETRCTCTRDECGCPTYGQAQDPDTFRTECERVCVSPELQCFKYKPAQYRVEFERFVEQPGRYDEVCESAKYETRTTQVCVAPGKWTWRRNASCEVPMPEPVAMPTPEPGLPALQVELKDQRPSGEEAGIFSVGETVRYELRVTHDDGSQAMPNLKVRFRLPPELKFVSGGGDGIVVESGAKVDGSHDLSTGVFSLNIGEVKTLQVMAQVVSVSPTHMIQTIASVQSENGQELARETESTTVK